MYNFTPNEKLAALHLVAECLDGMGGDRPMDLVAPTHRCKHFRMTPSEWFILYEWAESHWDEFVANGKPRK